MQIKTKKQSHAPLTYIQQRDRVVDRINLSGSQVIIGGFKTIKDFDWITKINHALSGRNSHLKIEEKQNKKKTWTDARRPVPRLWIRSAEVRGERR